MNPICGEVFAVSGLDGVERRIYERRSEQDLMQSVLLKETKMWSLSFNEWSIRTVYWKPLRGLVAEFDGNHASDREIAWNVANFCTDHVRTVRGRGRPIRSGCHQVPFSRDSIRWLES